MLINFINTTILYGVFLNMQVDRKCQAGLITTQMDFSASIRDWRRAWQPTPVFLPGESPGQKSLVGCSSWGCRKSDMTEWRTLGVGVFCTDLTTWKWASSPVFLLHSDSRRPSAGSFPSNVTPGWWGAAVYNRLVLCWGGANAELSPTAPGKWTLCPPTSFTTRTACQLPTASSLSANVVQAVTNLFADFKRKWDEMQKNPEEP